MISSFSFFFLSFFWSSSFSFFYTGVYIYFVETLVESNEILDKEKHKKELVCVT